MSLTHAEFTPGERRTGIDHRMLTRRVSGGEPAGHEALRCTIVRGTRDGCRAELTP
jgi:hypothetical protein